MADAYRELDGARVLVVGHTTGRGKRSGIPLGELSQRWANVIHIADGKVTRILSYHDADNALADLGLTPRSNVTPVEKLALLLRSYAAFGSGLDVEALIPLYQPECEFRMGTTGAAFGTEAFRGHDGLRALVAAIDEGFENWTPKIDEARINPAGALLLRFHATARSRGIRMELAIQAWQQIADRDGLILSVVQLDEPPSGWDEATPLDLGLTPDTGT